MMNQNIDTFNNIAWMQEILDMGNIGLWRLEVDRINNCVSLYANQQMLELLGLKKALPAREMFDYFSGRIVEGYQEIVQQYIDQIIDSKKFVEVQYQWMHPKWGTIFVRCSGKLEQVKDNVFHIRGYHQNITELEVLRERSILQEKKLVDTQRQHERYNELFQSVLCGIVQYRILEDGRVEFKSANKKAIKILGYEDEKEFWQKKDWKMSDLVAEEDKERILNELKHLVEADKNVIYEYRHIKKDGSICWLLGTANYIRDIDGEKVVQSVFLDIDRRKKMELANKHLEENERIITDAYQIALEASKAKSEFFSKMSHDIRTPMNAIMGLTNLAEIYVDDTERVRNYLHKILVSGKHMQELLNEVLDMSRIESGKMELVEEKISLPEQLQGLQDMLKPLLEEKQDELLVDYSQVEHLQVLGDSLRLQQILLNLLSNSIKYTQEQGKIKLTVLERTFPTNEISYFEFVVEDNGIGMEENMVEHIFEPFFRTEDSRISKIQGTGLGLTIALSLVKMMNGEIKVETALGAGSTFTVGVCLKVVTNEDQNLLEESSSLTKIFDAISQCDYCHKRVLVVEDNEINLEIAQEFIQMTGAMTERAVDGLDALEKFSASPEGYYDMIFMDIQMPKLNGYDATRKIRELSRQDAKQIPIVAMTANVFSEASKMALEAGMNEHLPKPFEPETLLKVLEKWLCLK